MSKQKQLAQRFDSWHQVADILEYGYTIAWMEREEWGDGEQELYRVVLNVPTPEPDTENLGNRLTAALQENAMLNNIYRTADKENDRLRELLRDIDAVYGLSVVGGELAPRICDALGLESDE